MKNVAELKPPSGFSGQNLDGSKFKVSQSTLGNWAIFIVLPNGERISQYRDTYKQAIAVLLQHNLLGDA